MLQSDKIERILCGEPSGSSPWPKVSKGAAVHVLSNKDGIEVTGTQDELAETLGVNATTISTIIGHGNSFRERQWTKAGSWRFEKTIGVRERTADFTWLNKRAVAGVAWRGEPRLGRAWDKSLIILRLYQNGIGAKEICRHLFGGPRDFPSVLACIKAHGVFEVGRKSPASFKPKPPEEAVAIKRAKEYDRQCSLAFREDHRQSMRAESAYRSFYIRPWEAQSRRVMRTPHLRIKFYLRKRLLGALKGKPQYSIRTHELIGCSPMFLRDYLAERFTDGMTWENHGPVWHIDHIIPCASFNLLDREEAKKCFHYTNLQPLGSIENIRKSNKLADGTRARHAA